MKYNKLGETGLEVSALSFGTAPLGDMFGAAEDEDTFAVVRRALDAGITFFDSSPYYGDGLAEHRLGAALRGRRSEVVLGTKAGRYGKSEFDYSPARIRKSLDESLDRLQTDYVDILQLHDVEFVELSPIFSDSYGELVKLRAEGKCRFIGMTGYPLATLCRAVQETDLDVVLSYAHHTLLNTQLGTGLLPLCRERRVGVINAAAVAIGLLTPAGVKVDMAASEVIRRAAERARRCCAERGADISFLANQFSIQRSNTPTTVIGTARLEHLESAIAAESEPIDEDLLSAVLSATSDVHDVPWKSGRGENN